METAIEHRAAAPAVLAKNGSQVSLGALPQLLTLKGLATYRSCRTALACLDSGAPSVGMMTKQLGVEATEGAISVMLVLLSDALNVKNQLREDDADFIAGEIVNSHLRNLNMAELNLIFSRARRGEYGEMYESLTTTKVMKWVNDYWDERLEAAGQRSRERANRERSNLPDLSNLTAQELAERLAEGWKRREEQEAAAKARAAEERKAANEAARLIWKADMEAAHPQAQPAAVALPEDDPQTLYPF